MEKDLKDLLLKDLCARLPYGVKVQAYSYEEDIETIETLYEINSDGYTSTIECDTLKNMHKPYLFPLSSMTEEQWNNAPRVNLAEFTFESFECGCFTLASYTCENELYDLIEFINWLLKNHFDIYGLIEKSLAIDCTNLNIY